MSISGFDLAQARYDGATPAVRELSDELGTNCLGFYEQTDTDDAFECEERSVCSVVPSLARGLIRQTRNRARSTSPDCERPHRFLS